MFSLPEPFLHAELDYRRQRLTEEFAAADRARRNRVARRRSRQLRAAARQTQRQQVARAR